MKLPPLSNVGNFFPKLKKDGDKRPFKVAQIETTSRCSTGCVFCPHDALASKWIEGDLPPDLYREKIAPHLDLFELVYLQGWGEPMLHPFLWDMLELARKKKCKTGFTTNGAWLEDESIQRLLNLGVNLISVSFAGTQAFVHESLRKHSNFDLLCANFENLANQKKRGGYDCPFLELHFLMTRANMDEFPALVELAASLGADEVVATNLSYAPSRALDEKHIFGDPPLREDLEIIARAQETARRLNLPLRVYPVQTESNTLVCDANPLETIYVNHRGEVAPCVYLGLTVEGQIPRFFKGEPHPFEPLTFGNIRDGLLRALESDDRKRFTETFKHRKLNGNPLMMFAVMAGEQQAELPSPPEPCKFCYKMLGV